MCSPKSRWVTEPGGHYVTECCTAHPGEHPARKQPRGCGGYACSHPVCQEKRAIQRTKAVYRERLGELVDLDRGRGLLHITLTTPPDLVPLTTLADAVALRSRASAYGERWVRQNLGVRDDEALFGVSIIHPQRDDPEWDPHYDAFVPTVALSNDGKLRSLADRAVVSVDALRDLREGWARELAEHFGRPVPEAVARYQPRVLARGAKRDARMAHEAALEAVVRAEFRGFPGWVFPAPFHLRVTRPDYWGALSSQRWGAARAALGISRTVGEPVGCTHRTDRYGPICGEPMLAFALLPAILRGFGREHAEPEEQVWHDHGARGELPEAAEPDPPDAPPRCSCDSCRRTEASRCQLLAEIGRELSSLATAARWCGELAREHPGAPLWASVVVEALPVLADLRNRMHGPHYPTRHDIWRARAPIRAMLDEASAKGLDVPVSDRAVAHHAAYRAELTELRSRARGRTGRAAADAWRDVERLGSFGDYYAANGGEVPPVTVGKPSDWRAKMECIDGLWDSALRRMAL